MRLDYLKEFQFVASTLNYTKAAKALNISQSSLSKHMIELERNTGLKLFNHDAAKTTLTPIGNEFLKEVSLMLSSYDVAVKKCLELQEQGFRTLTVHEASLSAAMRILYPCVQTYASTRPNVDISFDDIRTCNSAVDALKRKVVDVALDMKCGIDSQEAYVRDMSNEGYRVLPIYSEALIAWVRKDNRLAECNRLRFDDIKHEPIMTSSGKVFDSVRLALIDLFAREDLIPRFKMIHFATLSSNSSYFLSDFGDAVLFTTNAMIDDRRLSLRGDIIYKTTDDPKLHATIYLVTDTQNKLGLDFLDYVSQSCLA